MDIRLDGKVALISGGSLGLGRAMAAAMAASGADVAIIARRPDVLAEAKAEIESGAAGRVATFAGDVSRADEIGRLFAAVAEAFGQVDILVNNAGTSATGDFEDITDEIWQADLDLKLFAAIRLARLAFPAMKARQWGRIINVLNIGAKTPAGGSAPTTVSRAAGMALTKVLSKEGAPHNVLVNALCTGFFVTDQWHRRHQRMAPELTFEQFVAKAGEGVPIGRVGDAKEFANLACFLASDAASYLTGAAINIDGGASPVV
ncbi:MAG: SDR family oxidoreductase [Alphaproteobacteria bacterium]|jgi:NAD(P)-dependent dehydrogenase (short-subunit alcohol dehydrogenase family)|nr:SDR family oxidoreductase [Alphaproteobacteria bacterium]MDP6515141.1 SDR family oxidoreductase [Alphaproteobacteria bacterium]